MKTQNLSRCSFARDLKWRVFFSNLASRTNLCYASWKRRVISHWMTAPKNRGKCELPRFIGVNSASCIVCPYQRLWWFPLRIRHPQISIHICETICHRVTIIDYIGPYSRLAKKRKKKLLKKSQGDATHPFRGED